ncbi:MAG: hypothetical protein ACK5UE_00420 [Chitinophagales bacterium]|jgi:hypothetical protein|nr:hypothetical protein [Sphingobacteriales bacterium]
MKKIDKSEILATSYKTWLDNLGETHPEYTSSKHKFYYDIVANLVWIQGGLCAYTEVLLNDKKTVAPEKWVDGMFNRFEVKGALDHYFPNLKRETGWDWQNFFLIDYDINSKIKRDNQPHGILKPDKSDFDPFYFLEYNYVKHIFIPNSERDIDFQIKIKHDIDILGLNYGPIVNDREKYLKNLFSEALMGKKEILEIRKDLYKFYTAFEMSMKQLNIEEL